MKQLQITAPEGFEIDQDKSDLSKGSVFFKEIKKILRYEDIASNLFVNIGGYFINSLGDIELASHNTFLKNKNNSTTKEQLQSILALNQLCNVAKYLNGDWLPDFFDTQQWKHFLAIDSSSELHSIFNCYENWGSVFFRTKELALQAIEILGEETIRKALTLNH